MINQQRELAKKLIAEMDIIGISEKRIFIKKRNLTTELVQLIEETTELCITSRFSERIFWIINDIEDYPRCIACGKQWKPRYYGLSSTLYSEMRFCSNSCVSSNKHVIEKKRQTCKLRYGDEMYRNVEQIKKTNLERHGMEFPWAFGGELHTKLILEKFNVDNVFKSPIIIQRIKANRFKRTGYMSHMQDPEFKEYFDNLCFERTGYYNPFSDPKIMEKALENGYKNKKITLPSGNIINYRGYEHVAINYLLQYYSELEIETKPSNIPKIKFAFNGKDGIYYPDIFIPSENRIIEVKSTWTYKKDLEKNLTKQQACLDYGYNFEFWICSDKEILEIIK